MKKKILIVDDNQMMVAFLTRTLEDEGHQVVSAQDGLIALDILTTLTPNIIFIDLIMPQIGGDKLIKIIRKMPHLNDCFLVIISGAIGDMELEYTNIDADMYIAKGPFSQMAGHVLGAVKESDLPRPDGKTKPAVGLEAADGVPVHARQMTKELLSKSRYQETILESMAEGILVVYSDKVVYANSAALSLFDVPEEKLIASYLPDLFGDKTHSQVERLLKSGADITSVIGQDMPLELNNRMVIIKCMQVKGEPLTRILLISDVTEIMQMQMQLQHLNKMEAIGNIANGVAHNFRNILAGILANNQVIQLELEETSGVHENTKRIDSSVKRGAQLIDGLMQFSRKQIKNEFKLLSLNAVIQETIQIVKETFDKKVEIQIETPEPLSVMGDRSELSLAFMNLCTNAKDAMPAGGKLRIATRQEGSMAVVIVSDTGQGMDEATAEKCFDPFFTTKEVGKGTGLGLSTTYGIIKNHKGEIHVDSETNKGSAFKILLPLAVFEDQIDQESLPELEQGNGKKVLFVDDDMEILEAIPTLLKRLGYQVAISSSAKEAIDKYKVWHPDVVLMDINMPGIDGIACIEKIADYDPDVKAIIISGYEKEMIAGLDQHKKEFIKGFLIKPFGSYALSTSPARLLNP